MRLSKKAMMGMVVGLVILILSAYIILELWGIMFSKADDASAEGFCYGFNAMRARSQVKSGNLPLFDVAPRTCKTIEKTIPSDDYPQTKQGAMAEISDMSARCWWMWLEGAERNMFRDWPGGKEPCFNCYSFNIKKGIDSFTGAELGQHMRETAYIVKDGSDNCAAIGGGFCADDCSRFSESSSFSAKEVSSKKCEEGKKCCVSTKRADECRNKGGICISLGTSACKDKNPDYPIKYGGWTCAVSGESCCIKEEHFYSYFGYVQNYNGKGAILYPEGKLKLASGEDSAEEFQFKSLEETYSVSLISPDQSFTKTGSLVALGTLLGGTTAAVLLCSTVIGCVIPLAVGIPAAGAGASIKWFSENSDVNMILIAPLNAVSDKCAIEADVAGK